MSDDLEVFFPVARVLRLRAHEVKVLPLHLGITPAFLKAVAPAMALLQLGQFQPALMDQKDSLRDALNIATGLTKEDIDALYNDEVLQLLIAVVEVNLGFFVQRVVPQLSRLVPLIVPPGPSPATAGPASSPVLSEPVTA